MEEGKLTDEVKQEINAMDYEQMLRHNRFDPAGSRFFIGQVGMYFMKVMSEKKADLSPGEAVSASKRIGWEN